VRWKESKCLAAKRSLQERAAKLLLCAVGYLFFVFFRVINLHGRWFLGLHTTVEAMCSKGLRATILSAETKVYAGQNA